MTKLSLKNIKGKKSSNFSLKQIREVLKKNHACYVLITCDDPTPDGRMEVELSYDGDDSLAAYLVHSAQNVFDDGLQQSSDSC